MIPIIKFKKLHSKAIIPKFQTSGSSGFDFHAIVDEKGSDFDQAIRHCDSNGNSVDPYFVVYPNHKLIISTGLALVIPSGYEIQMRPRSGLAFKNSIIIHFGTIDSDFRGEIKIALFNLGASLFFVRQGDRIAQGILQKVPKADIIEIDEFSEEDLTNDRGGGYGSTGR
tara:strand:+ start:6569 stop:7075 length:507 start_codon:yes stop_codon:yes gene_type:complete